MYEPPPSRDDLPSRIGRAMLFGAWIVAIALLVMLFNSLFERQENPNPNPLMTQGADGAKQVILERNRAGHFVASGTINGVPVRFLVDTGATNVALSLPLARRLELPMRPGGMSMTANGLVKTWSTRLDQVTLGGLTLHHVRASVLPNMPGKDVLLGMSYLRHLELIQRGNILILRPHDSG